MIVYDPILTGSLILNGVSISSLGSVDAISGSVVELVAASSSFSQRVTTAESSVSSLNSATSSYLLNTSDTLTGDLTVTGTIIAQQFHTEYISASILYDSGSTKFGDSLDDVHSMTGSLQVSGSSHYLLGAVSINKDTADTTLDVGGSITGLGLRTNSTNTNYNFISRDSAGNALFVQSVQSNANQNIATFQYGSATVNAGNIVLQVSKDSSYFTNTNVGIGTTSPSAKLDVNGGTDDNTPKVQISGNDAIIRMGSNHVGGPHGLQFDYESTLPATDGMSLYYRTGPEQITFEDSTGTSGNKIMVIGRNGNVGIGTTSPSDKLQVDGYFRIKATQPKIRLEETDTTDENFEIRVNGGDLIFDKITDDFSTTRTERLRIDSSGNIGIGTTAPSVKFEIQGTDAKVKINNTTATTTDLVILDLTGIVQGSGTGNERAILLGKDGNAARQAKISYTQGTSNGQLPSLSFFTGDNVDSLDERMRINSSGNVGIGTASPSEKLDVVGGGLAAGNGTIRTGITYSSIGLIGTFSNHDLGVITNGTQRMVINSSGNVGIGETNPGYKLHVNGSFFSTGNSTLANAINAPIINVGNYPVFEGQGASAQFGFSRAGTGFVTYIGSDSGYLFRLWNESFSNGYFNILQNGNVGIGATSPNAKLEVNGNIYTTSNTNFLLFGTNSGANPYIQGGSDNALYFGTGGGAKIIITPSGDVGIGTQSPSGKFHIDHGDTYHMGILHEYASTFVTRTKFGRPGTTSNLELYYDIAGAEIAKITRNYSSAQLQFDRAGTVDMLINGSGNVGIGTTNLPFKLNVESSTDTVARIKSTGASGKAQLILNAEGAGAGSTGDGIVFFDMNSTAWVAGIDKSDGSKFKIANDVYGDFRANNYFAIQTNGNVGIGTTDPTAKLDIGGSVRFRGSVYDEFTFFASGGYSAGTYYTICNSSQLSTPGVYMVVAYLDTYAVGGGIYFSTFASVPFFWFAGGSNSNSTQTLPTMLGTGHHNLTPPTIRIRLDYGANGGLQYLEFDPNGNWSNINQTSGATVVFYLRKIG